MDRYRRLYWHFPSLRGVLVESLESSVSGLTSAPTDLNLDLEDPGLSAPNPSSNQSSQLPNKPELSKSDQYISDQYKSDQTQPDIKNEKMDSEPTDYSTPVTLKPETGKPNLTHQFPKLELTNSLGSTVTTGPCNTPPVLGRDNTTNSVKGFASQSIASWLNSAIDNVFEAGHASPSISRPLSAVDSPSLASSRVESSSTLNQLPSRNNSRPQLQTGSSISQLMNQSASSNNDDEAWFDLNRFVRPSYVSAWRVRLAASLYVCLFVRMRVIGLCILYLPTYNLLIHAVLFYMKFDIIDRKLPCSRLPSCSPALVASSLAFMSCAIGSEEQKEIEALEALAAKVALLDKPKSVPAGKLFLPVAFLIVIKLYFLILRNKSAYSSLWIIKIYYFSS